LGTVIAEESSVANYRCTFFEPFSSTNSWRVVDADNNVIPATDAGATYYVAVFLQQHQSAKIDIAVGTWVEDFQTRYRGYDIHTPTCTRNGNDFYEKQGLQ
jgi:hypothetical protein